MLGDAEEIAAAVLDQAAGGVGAVGPVEGGEDGNGVTTVRQLEHRALIVGAAIRGRTKEIAAAVLNEAGLGERTGGIAERRENRNGAAVVRQLEDRALAVRSASLRRAEKIAGAVLNQATGGVCPVGIVKGREGAERAGYAPILELPHLQLRSARSSDAGPLRGMARRPCTGQRVKPGTQDCRRHLGFPQRYKAAPNAKRGQ